MSVQNNKEIATTKKNVRVKQNFTKNADPKP